MTQEEIDKVAQAFVNKKELEWFDPDTKTWRTDTPMHSLNELLMFISYGCIFRIKT